MLEIKVVTRPGKGIRISTITLPKEVRHQDFSFLRIFQQVHARVYLAFFIQGVRSCRARGVY